MVNKAISVLSGGERARLCLAGLILSDHNVLVLDEPGNHLDLDTVEALAEALCEFDGTVIFTSHDRHFLKKVATSIVEVRDGRVVAHHGKYEAYLAKVNEEIDAGERELASSRAQLPVDVLKHSKPRTIRSEKDVRKEIKTVEKVIAAFDEQKKTAIGDEIEAIDKQLHEAQDRWAELQEELEAVA
jgi:ATP-binding cassette subfamily F protein 3